MRRDRRPHALAWWLWGIGLAGAALRTTNPILLLGLGTVAVAVGAACSRSRPGGARSGSSCGIGLVVVLLRVVLEIVFGERPARTRALRPALASAARLGSRGQHRWPGDRSRRSWRPWSAASGSPWCWCAFGAVNAVASPRELLRSPAGDAPRGRPWPSPWRSASFPRSWPPSAASGRPGGSEADRPAGSPGSGARRCPCSRTLSSARASWPPPWAPEASAAPVPPRAAPCGSARRARRSSSACSVVVGGAYGVLRGGGACPSRRDPASLGAVLLWVGLAAGHRRSARSRYRPAPFGCARALCAPERLAARRGLRLVGALGLGSGVAGARPPCPGRSLPVVALLGIVLGGGARWRW